MELPNEVVLLVFEFLGVGDLAACARVSTEWGALAATNMLWQHHYRAILGNGHPSLTRFRSSTSTPSSASAPPPVPANAREIERGGAVDWKRALRGAWSAKRNWRRGRPTHREAFHCHTRASGLCFDHRFLYVGLNRGCVQVFDLHSNHDAAHADAETAKDDDGGDEGNEVYSGDTSSTPSNSTAPLIYFPTSSTSSSASGEVEAAADEGEGLVVPMADGPRKKPVVLHSPHSSYSDVLAIHDQRLYAVSGKSIVVWDVDVCEAKEIKRVEIAYEGHTNKVSCIDFSGHHLITGSWDQTIRMWDINTGVCLNSMTGHTANIKHLQTADHRIVSSSNDNTLMEWDMRSCTQVRSTCCTKQSAQAAPAVSAFHYDPDRDLIVIGQREGTVQRLCYSEIFAQNRFLMGMPGSAVMRLHKGLIHRIQMDAYKVLTSGQDGIIGVWDLATGGLLYRVQTGCKSSLNAMQFDHTQLFHATGASVERLAFSDDW
jgi:WD40 repeat protein